MTDTPTPELLPCPFCGGDAEIDAIQGFCTMFSGRLENRFAISCTSCTADMGFCYSDVESIHHETAIQQTIKDWNTRATIEQSSIVDAHQPTTTPFDDSETPIGDHQTPHDWTIAEALRLMEWSPNEMGLRKVPASVTPKVVREHALGNMIWAQNTLAHAATLQKLAGLQTAYQATAEAAATHLKTAMDAEAKLAMARAALKRLDCNLARETLAQISA